MDIVNHGVTLNEAGMFLGQQVDLPSYNLFLRIENIGKNSVNNYLPVRQEYTFTIGSDHFLEKIYFKDRTNVWIRIAFEDYSGHDMNDFGKPVGCRIWLYLPEGFFYTRKPFVDFLRSKGMTVLSDCKFVSAESIDLQKAQSACKEIVEFLKSIDKPEA